MQIIEPNLDFISLQMKVEKPIRYDLIWGVFASWMLTWSIIMNVSYYWKKSCNNNNVFLWTDTCQPWTFWRIFSWYEVIFWSYSWGLWMVNLIFDNKGGKIMAFWAVYTIFYMIGPIVIDNLFLFLTWFAYPSTVIASDPNFWFYWYGTLLNELACLTLFYFTVWGIQN